MEVEETTALLVSGESPIDTVAVTRSPAFSARSDSGETSVRERWGTGASVSVALGPVPAFTPSAGIAEPESNSVEDWSLHEFTPGL